MTHVCSEHSKCNISVRTIEGNYFFLELRELISLKQIKGLNIVIGTIIPNNVLPGHWVGVS